MWEVRERCEISVAHHLPLVPEEHKCRRLHGHNYIVEACVRGRALRPDGFVMDFQQVKDTLAKELGKLDHRNLNDTFENPTVEYVLAFIFPMLARELPGLAWVRMWETSTSAVTYYGPGGQ